jgi:hypothetical protein
MTKLIVVFRNIANARQNKNALHEDHTITPLSPSCFDLVSAIKTFVVFSLNLLLEFFTRNIEERLVSLKSA